MKSLKRSFAVMTVLAIMSLMTITAGAKGKPEVRHFGVGEVITISKESGIKSITNGSSDYLETRDLPNSRLTAVTAVKPGSTFLIYFGKDGAAVKHDLVIVTDRNTFKYDTKKLTLKKGKSKVVKLKAPKYCKVTYESSNKKVATVNKSGKITAKSKGKTVIMAKAYFKGKHVYTSKKVVVVSSKKASKK